MGFPGSAVAQGTPCAGPMGLQPDEFGVLALPPRRTSLGLHLLTSTSQSIGVLLRGRCWIHRGRTSGIKLEMRSLLP